MEMGKACNYMAGLEEMTEREETEVSGFGEIWGLGATARRKRRKRYQGLERHRDLKRHRGLYLLHCLVGSLLHCRQLSLLHALLVSVLALLYLPRGWLPRCRWPRSRLVLSWLGHWASLRRLRLSGSGRFVDRGALWLFELVGVHHLDALVTGAPGGIGRAAQQPEGMEDEFARGSVD